MRAKDYGTHKDVCAVRGSGEVVLADGDAGYAVEARGKTDAGRGGDFYCAFGGYGDFGSDYIFLPVTVAGGDVAGEGEIGKSGHGDILGAADAGFEHAAAPDRNAIALAKIVDAFGLEKTADATEFDIDDFASAEGDGGFGLFVGVDAFVETDGRLKIFLDFDVAEEIVPAQGLLDHHEVVGIELLEERKIFVAVGGVGIDH